MSNSSAPAGSVRLAMFAKHWQPGKVKTRLAQVLGQRRAAAIYKAFLDTQVARYDELEFDARTIFYTPNDRQRAFQHLVSKAKHSWTLEPQIRGDLGQRMQTCFERTFQAGYERLVLVGSDTPNVPLGYLAQVEHLLSVHDVVLGPTYDGGYYLVAAKNSVPPIFADIPWSTPNVWSQTIARLQHNQVRFAVLPTWYDVDVADDFKHLRQDLASDSGSCADRLTRLGAQLDAIMDSDPEETQ